MNPRQFNRILNLIPIIEGLEDLTWKNEERKPKQKNKKRMVRSG
jgi:hypothetical protein